MHLYNGHVAGGAVIDEPDKAICPVMQIPVSKAEATETGLVQSYKGEIFYFCCNTCTTMFDENVVEYVITRGGNQ